MNRTESWLKCIVSSLTVIVVFKISRWHVWRLFTTLSVRMTNSASSASNIQKATTLDMRRYTRMSLSSHLDTSGLQPQRLKTQPGLSSPEPGVLIIGFLFSRHGQEEGPIYGTESKDNIYGEPRLSLQNNLLSITASMGREEKKERAMFFKAGSSRWREGFWNRKLVWSTSSSLSTLWEEGLGIEGRGGWVLKAPQ